jgi:two-component system, OmpR family, sensor kinase
MRSDGAVGAQIRMLVFAMFALVVLAVAGLLGVEIAAHSRDSAVDTTPWILATLALVSLFAGVAFLFGRSMAARISRPLVDIRQVVDRWATGESAARAVPSGPREVRGVADALNSFADQNARVRELEEQVVDSLADLDRAKSDFLSTVSHELRTPLTSITGYVELLEDELDNGLTEQQSSMLAVVKRNVTRLRALIEDLLTLAQAESEPFRASFDVLDLCHLTSDVAYELQAMAATRGVTIREVHPPRKMVMLGDGTQLSRALFNLVTNAVKFSPDGSDVTIRVKQSLEWAHVEVTDHGIGIPAREMASLGTRFFRASNAVVAEITGTGLGLRIVQAIVDNHGGHLEIESVEGEGTTTRMVVPLAEPSVGKKNGVGTVEQSVSRTLGAGQ